MEEDVLRKTSVIHPFMHHCSHPLHLLIQLIRKAINANNSIDTDAFCDVEWTPVWKTAIHQGVLGVTYDAIPRLPANCRPDTDHLMDWTWQVIESETKYQKHRQTLSELSDVYSSNGINMILMKGYGLSLNYPLPHHRPVGDADIFLIYNADTSVVCQKTAGEKGDEIIKNLGCNVKLHEVKHSVFDYKDLHVENHSDIINEMEHPSLRKLEKFLKQELKSHSVLDPDTKCYLPSDLFNALFLPLHLGFHFVYGGTILRQLCDWAMFVASDKRQIDWDKVKELAIEAGYFRFLCCINGILISVFGVPSRYLPDWPREEKLQPRVFEVIIGKNDLVLNSTKDKLKRYFNSRWKYNLVFSKDNYIAAFFRRMRSFFIWKWGIGGSNIWARKNLIL